MSTGGKPPKTWSSSVAAEALSAFTDPFIRLQAVGFLLRQAIHERIRVERRQDTPLWVITKRMFVVGSTSAAQICKYVGLNPDQTVGEYLNEYKK